MLTRFLPVLLVFFLSGATALVYEVLWTRQLSLIFGVTTYAVSAVLATYMGGLALGSFLVGRFVDRVRSPLMLYAVLEAAIGIYALLVPFLLAGLRPVYIEIAHLGLSYPVFSALRVLLAVAVLLIPTTMMGGTYPVLLRHWVRDRADMGRGAGVLYFVNTAGAIAGCSLAGFVLLENLGISGTNYLAAVTNLALAAVAALLSRRAPVPGEAAAADAENGLRPGRRQSSGTESLILLCIGLSGFVSLCAQVLWSRALLRYLYNSTYAFTAMLAVFLLGITIGSAVFTALLPRLRRPLVAFVILQVGAGVGLVVSLLVYPHLLEFPDLVFGTSIIHSFRRSVFTMLLYAGLVLLPFVIFLGALFPLATYLYASGRDDIGRASGHVYAANTLGAILGSLGCGFVLIPTIGMWGTHRLLVVLCFLGAVMVAMTAVRRASTRAAVALALVAGACAVLVAAPGDVFRSTFLKDKASSLVFYEEGATDTVGVQETDGQRMIVYEDLRGTASTSTYGWNFFLGHLPMLLHPGTPAKVLHICFGVGNSLSAVASHEELERVDNVELSPHILGAGPLFWTNGGVLEHPKVRTIIDDGRNYLMTTTEKYDVILLEPPETFTAGVINLYTVEFYRDALARLEPDGLLMQWIPTANAPLDGERDLFRSFYDVFPHATMWWQLTGGSALLVGSREKLEIDYQKLRRHFDEPRVRQDLLISQVRDVDHFLSFLIFDEVAFADFVKDASPVTDHNTVLDFSMPRYVGSGFGLGQFTDKAIGDGKTPFDVVGERRDTYRALRRSVVPYLTNLQGESAEAVSARIEAAAGIAAIPLAIPRQEWERLRASASGQ